MELDSLIILLDKYQYYDPNDTRIDSSSQSRLGPSSGKEYFLVPHDRTFRDAFSGIDILELSLLAGLIHRYPVFHVIFPSDLSKYRVVNLPLLPLDPWSPPERKPKNDEEKTEEDRKWNHPFRAGLCSNETRNLSACQHRDVLLLQGDLHLFCRVAHRF